MIIGVPKEIYPGERRVSLVPLVVPTLTKAGFEVAVESCAGVEAGYPDNLYTDKGAKIVPTRAELFQTADIITQVLGYGANDVTGKADMPLLRRDQILIGFLRPLGSLEVVQQIAATGAMAPSAGSLSKSLPPRRSLIAPPPRCNRRPNSTKRQAQTGSAAGRQASI